MSEFGGGIALINDGKYGIGIDEGAMSLSLLRATIRPDVVSDMGKHSFCYMILPHDGDPITAGVNEIATDYNVPLVKSDAEWTLPHFEGLFLQAAKKSEVGTMTVIRLIEQKGRRGQIKLDRRVKILNMLEETEYEM
jgi:alpha-mannosidase